MADPTIYDLLSKKDISEVTVALLNAATKVTAVDRKTVPFWTGPITLSQAVSKSRTYPRDMAGRMHPKHSRYYSHIV